jgi:hypothetical protein
VVAVAVAVNHVCGDADDETQTQAYNRLMMKLK